MKVLASRQDLSRATKLLSKIIVKHFRQHPYGWFKLSTAGDLIIEAVSEKMHIKLRVPAMVREEGEVCVEADEFAKAVRSSKSLNWSMSVEDNKLVVYADYTSRAFDVKPVEEFPKFPECDYQYSLPVEVLREGLSKVGFAVDKTNKYKELLLNYVLIDGKGDYLNFVGCDGYRLAIFKVDIPFSEKLYIYRDAVDILLQRLKYTYGNVEIGVSGSKHLCLKELKSFEVAVQMNTEYEYVDYESVRASYWNTVVKVYSKDLSEVLSKFAKSDTVIFELTKSEEGFRVNGEWVYGRVVGEDLTIAFRPKHILEFLKEIEGYIQIGMNCEREPAVFLTIPKQDYEYVLMPVLLNND